MNRRPAATEISTKEVIADGRTGTGPKAPGNENGSERSGQGADAPASVCRGRIPVSFDRDHCADRGERAGECAGNAFYENADRRLYRAAAEIGCAGFSNSIFKFIS